jgi:predicted short-subunit dehydrogenase-like oxidoreductase (DUF2520 family)
MATKLPKISIIGTGNVGGALALALTDKGYKIASIIDTNGSRVLNISKIIKCEKVGVVVTDVALSTDIIFITVNDNQIANVVSDLLKNKKLYLKKMLIIHCSGAYPSKILEPLRKKGALIGAMHPIQTFPSSQNPIKLKTKFRGIYFGISGSDESLKWIEQIVKNLEGKTQVIPDDLKPLYHVASVFASNYEMILLNSLSELTAKLRLSIPWSELFGQLLTASMENMMKDGIGKALTGPIVRGDMGTIDLHLKTIDEHSPHLLPLYTICGVEAARVAKENNRLTDEDFNEIILKFRKFVQSSSIKKITKGKK